MPGRIGADDRRARRGWTHLGAARRGPGGIGHLCRTSTPRARCFEERIMIQVGWFTSASRMLALATVFAAGPAMAHMQAATSCRMAELAVKGLQYSGAGIGALHTRTEVICPVDRLT